MTSQQPRPRPHPTDPTPEIAPPQPCLTSGQRGHLLLSDPHLDSVPCAMENAPQTPDERDPFALPSPDVLREIQAKQDARAQEIRAARAKRAERKSKSVDVSRSESTAERTAAAELIQKNYRGHRTRRAMQGRGLDPSVRWIEVLKEAKYNRATAPVSRDHHASLSSPGRALDRWKRAGAIAHRAGSDDTSDSELDDANDEEKAKIRERRRRDKREREKYAKVMGLDYFLEMVDHKHRYGSNLRRYHHEWKQSESHENFFYWLDYGEGKDLDLEDRPRKRLDTEQVRYLSRENRQKYLVNIDSEGRFVFAKNKKLVTTSPEFRDSIDGIVPADDDTPTWREVVTGEKQPPAPDSDLDSLSSMSSIGTGKHQDTSKYTNEEIHNAKGISKLNHISANSVMNHMLRKTTKANTWIFVADTSFRLYIGIKQSGAFQHSSFLHGARVSAAGLIKIKRGQLRKLSPLSGHYAPPVKNFREFVRNLKEAGADMSRCNISRSYAVLLGLEGYLTTKRHVKSAEQGMKDILNPEEKRRREEAAKDKSESAQRERQVLAEEEMRARRNRSFSLRIKRRMGLLEEKEIRQDELAKAAKEKQDRSRESLGKVIDERVAKRLAEK